MLNTLKLHPKNLQLDNPLFSNMKHFPAYFLRPLRLFRSYDLTNLRPDLIAGLTVGVVLLPQAIAFSLIAELPPEMGLYTAIVGGIVGALWGSFNQTQTSPTNTLSLLVLSVLLTVAQPGTPEFIVAAGMLAAMAGVFQLVMGLARLGVLVNFVSHSVIVGFASGAGILIGVSQLSHLLGLRFPTHSLAETIYGLATHLPETHWPTAILGIGTIIFILSLRRYKPKLPASLVSMALASLVVFLLSLDKLGVNVIGQLPAGYFPLANLPLLDWSLIARLSTGALAVGAIGLVQTAAIAHSISVQTGQRLDSNQEFVGQGLANIASGLFSGYPCSGSFSCSAVSFKAGAKTPLSAIIAGLFLFIALFALAPLAAYLPRTALAGALIITAYSLVNRAEIIRIWRGTRGDALIMLVTFLGTLFLPLEFAVLSGILLSFALYIIKTSIPQVYPVLPDENFKHFVQQMPDQKPCPQLGILKISGDLYFGAVSHVEESIHQHLLNHPEQRFLLFRMHGVNQCDFSGIYMLEHVRRHCRDRGGDIFFMKVQKPVLAFMKSTGFYTQIGADHFLVEEEAIAYLFHKVLDPVVCIYECNVRAFWECQNLPKRDYSIQLRREIYTPNGDIPRISPQQLRQRLLRIEPIMVIDVREPREFNRGHIPQAQLIPLSKILAEPPDLPIYRQIVLVCRTGRRSLRAAQVLQKKGCLHVSILQGGMVAWETAGLLEAIEL
jgi:SulP family sulfate permease